VVFASGYFKQGTPINQSNTSIQEVNNTSNSNETAVNVVATQSGPLTAHQGENVSINYSVTNKDAQAIYNVKIHDQNFDKTLGTINPGETRKFQQSIHIPTDAEVKEDFGPDATVSNPFFIGGFAVTFQIANGSEHSINSNSIEIKLV
jgi:hypothetical protein